MSLAVILGAALSLVHFFSEQFCFLCKGFHAQLRAVAAGISIAFIFFHLFPQFSFGVASFSPLIFLSVLAGFVLIHLVESFIYQQSSGTKRSQELQLEDSAISFIYHVVVGLLLVRFLSISVEEGLLFFIPVVVYTAISTLPVDISSSLSVKIIVAFSTLLGVLLGLYVWQLSDVMFFLLLGFVVGVLSYTVIRHLPPIKAAQPLWFVIGVVFYSAILIVF